MFKPSEINIPSLLKISENELNKIGRRLNSFGIKNIAVFYSAGIEDIYGKTIDESFKQYNIKVLHKSQIEQVDIENVIHCAFALPKKTEALIGIGGGKALDYSKYCAHVLSVPFISVPTSTSNDGFCSSNTSLIVEGKRRSIHATIPFGVLVDINVIKASPENCILSGLGDLISKITSCYDWKQAFKKHNEPFNDFAYLIAKNSVVQMLHYRKKGIRNPEFLSNLVNSLLMSGISMEVCGSSRPASGSEHLISHALDATSKNPRMHGLQVGVATYLCSMLQKNQSETVRDFLTTTGFFDYMSKNPLDKEEFIAAVNLAPEIKENYYTILSDDGIISSAIKFIETDEILTKILK